MIALLAALALVSTPPGPPDRDYLMFVASEGNDRIALVRFGPGGAAASVSAARSAIMEWRGTGDAAD